MYETSDELEHYGVLGMKWHQRKARKEGSTYRPKSQYTKGLERSRDRAKTSLEKAKAVGDRKRVEKFSAKYNKFSKMAKTSADLNLKTKEVALKEFKGGKGAAKYVGLQAVAPIYGPLRYSEAIAMQPKIRKGKAVVNAILTSGGMIPTLAKVATKTPDYMTYVENNYYKKRKK